jgi:branched-chain amino acid transport system permease protein
VPERTKMEKTKKAAIGLILAIVFLIFAPFFSGAYWTKVLSSVFMFGITAEALNIIAGYTGYPAFGNVGFFGLGAYVVGVLMTKVSLPFIPALLISGGIAALFAVLFGLPVLRLKGHYFAIATLGIAEFIQAIVYNWTSLTGGGDGITMPIIQKSPEWVNLYFYYLNFIVLVLCTACVWLISRSRFGYTLRAIRGNEDAAMTMGINTRNYKVLAWAISAFFTGLAGGIYAYWFTYIDPGSVFDLFISVKMWVMLLLGGGMTVFGPLVGAFLFEMLSEVIWGEFLFIHAAVLGGVIILIVLFMPQGFMKLIRQRISLATFLANIRENRVT